MIWFVGDDGRVEVRLQARGEQAIKVARVQADRFIANIVGDWATTLGIEATLDELRYSFSKTRPEVTIIWKTTVPAERVAEVREYLRGLAASMNEPGGAGEIEDGTPDQ